MRSMRRRRVAAYSGRPGTTDLQRNAISIVAHTLQLAGIIRYSRGSIDITNLAGLKQTACECYDAINAHHRRLLNISY